MNLFNRQEIRRYASYNDISGRVDVPSIQRSLDPERVAKIRNHIEQRVLNNKEPIFGAIDLCQLDGRYYVIDGQHRLKALEEDYKATSRQIPFNCVIYHIQSQEEMKDIFVVRNEGVPVPEWVINPPRRVQLLREIENWILLIRCFKNSANTKRPYININDFMNRLSRSKLFVLVNTLSEFQQVFNKINQTNYLICNDSIASGRKNISDAMKRKCVEIGTWIGVDLNMPWFDDTYDMSEFNILLTEVRQTQISATSSVAGLVDSMASTTPIPGSGGPRVDDLDDFEMVVSSSGYPIIR